MIIPKSAKAILLLGVVAAVLQVTYGETATSEAAPTETETLRVLDGLVGKYQAPMSDDALLDKLQLEIRQNVLGSSWHPYIGWIIHRDWAINKMDPVMACPDLGSFNRIQDIFNQEGRDATNFQTFRDSDPTKGFAYWSALQKDIEDIKVAHQACGVLKSGTAILVLDIMASHASVPVFLVQTTDGRRSYVAGGSFDRQ